MIFKVKFTGFDIFFHEEGKKEKEVLYLHHLIKDKDTLISEIKTIVQNYRDKNFSDVKEAFEKLGYIIVQSEDGADEEMRVYIDFNYNMRDMYDYFARHGITPKTNRDMIPFETGNENLDAIILVNPNQFSHENIEAREIR
ncbi:MAG: hypothetical protein E7374_01345 [Clostridiales bacterium]|nr:hypothetical protein [Clostridiales bacterium]